MHYGYNTALSAFVLSQLVRPLQDMDNQASVGGLRRLRFGGNKGQENICIFNILVTY